jgi:hypothetical protein
MKQIFESILGLKTKISNLIHYSSSNSHNKTEYHFHGTVNIIGSLPKTMKSKFDSLFPRLMIKKNKTEY